MNNVINGKIIKGVGGLYFVKTQDQLVPCRARGIFRKEKITPCVGDIVEITMEAQEGLIVKILPRKNQLIRPAVSNIDKLFIVTSTVSPSPNYLLIDKVVAIAEVKNIEPILVITKTDLKENTELEAVYKSIGIKTFCVASTDGVGIEKVYDELKDSLSAFTGNSGVGKSTLLNALMPELELETGETSKKLGRGKHTTRHVEIFTLNNGGLVADTPGFSTLDFQRFELIETDYLEYGFREFEEYRHECKFTSCTHTCEKGCAVLKAASEGLIQKSRLESYIAMYNEVKDVKKWQIKRNV